jgi:hypothetical protein
MLASPPPPPPLQLRTSILDQLVLRGTGTSLSGWAWVGITGKGPMTCSPFVFQFVLGISRAEVDRALRARWGLASSDTYVRSAAVRVYAIMCWGSCLGVSAEEHCTLPFALFGWFGTRCLQTYVVWVDGCTIVTHAWLFPPTFCPQ